MTLHWLRVMLYEWGVRNRARGLGYPTMAATEKARIGRGGIYREPELPPDLEALDAAVLRLECADKAIIAECYTHYGTHDEHMARLRMARATYFRRKKIAETRVYWLLRNETPDVNSVAA